MLQEEILKQILQRYSNIPTSKNVNILLIDHGKNLTRWFQIKYFYNITVIISVEQFVALQAGFYFYGF